MRIGSAKRAIAILAITGAVGVGVAESYAHLPDITTARLPGAPGGSRTYHVTAAFPDVLSLVPNSTVRLNDVAIGRVSAITVGDGGPTGHYAKVGMEIDDRYDLPANTAAAIENTSLLGEKFVALTVPGHRAGSLKRSGTIPLTRTTADVEVEQLLSSFGALLNGGGLQQLSVITQQFSEALDGHEQSTRRLLGDLDQIVTRLSSGRTQLVAAIDGAERLSRIYSAQHKVLGDAIDALDPATGVIAQQEKLLTKALRSLRKLDSTARPLIEASTNDTVADLDALGPVTQQLGKVAGRLPRVLSTLLTYPFPDAALPSFTNAYSGTAGALTLDLPLLLSQIVPTPTGGTGDSAASGASSRTASPSAQQPRSQGSGAQGGTGLAQQLLGTVTSLLGHRGTS